MKTLLFLMLSFLTYAQSPYPDTLFLNDGRTFPCLLTQINESRVEVTYSKDIIRVVFIPSVQRISLEEHGIIYSSTSGFVKGLDSLQAYIDKRSKEIGEEEAKNESLMKNNPDKQILNLDRKWSFGILLIPYYSGTIYNLSYNNSYPPYSVSTYGYSNNEINMEGQFSYGVSPNTRLTFDVAYNSTFNETRDEQHNRDVGYVYDSGSLNTSGLDLLDLSLGAKYYFIDFFAEKVNAYVLAGIGKQFAFVKEESKNLYPQQPTYITEDNREEYLNDLNSPWHLNFGFGVEYLFNESLSLTSNIRFLYSSVSAKYNSRYFYMTQTQTSSEEYTNSQFITRIGVGLNFYF